MINPVYTSDWFNRDSSFTYSKESDINWAQDSQTFSDFVWGRRQAQNMLNSDAILLNELCILKQRFNLPNVTIKLSKGDSSYTDCCSEIVVGRDLTDADVNPFKALDVIVGLTIHEVSHCLFTNKQYLVKENIHHYLQNVLEDEMIETQMVNKFPGYANFFRSTKYHFFDKLGKETIGAPSKNELEAIMKIFQCCIRYPKYLNEIASGDLEKYADVFVKIKNIVVKMVRDIEAADFKTITFKTAVAADEIYKLIKDYIDNEDMESLSGDGENKGDGQGNGSFAEQCEEFDNTQLGEALQALNNMLKEMGERPDNMEVFASQQKPQSLKDFDDFTDVVLNKFANKGSRSRTYGIRNLVSNTQSPMTKMWANELRCAVTAFKKIEANKKSSSKLVETRFLRNGNLDSRLLASAVQGIPTVYSKRGYVTNGKKSRFALVISLDESGSVQRRLATLFAKYTLAFIEAYKNNPDVEVYVYGHGDDVAAYGAKNIFNISALCSNSRGQYSQNESSSYELIINDVQKQTNLPIVFVNFTDSGYCDSETNIRNIVKKYQNKVSFNLIAILSASATSNDIKYVDELNSTIYGEGNYITDKFDEAITPALATNITKLINHNYKRFVKGEK